jgi:hypothetical protein
MKCVSGAVGSFLTKSRHIIFCAGGIALLILYSAWVVIICLEDFYPSKTERSPRSYIRAWHNFTNSSAQPSCHDKIPSFSTLSLVSILDRLITRADSFRCVKYIFSLPWNEIDSGCHLRLTPLPSDDEVKNYFVECHYARSLSKAPIQS